MKLMPRFSRIYAEGRITGRGESHYICGSQSQIHLREKYVYSWRESGCQQQNTLSNTPESVLVQTIHDGVPVVDDLHQFGHQLLFSLAVPACFQMICSNTKHIFKPSLIELFHVLLNLPSPTNPHLVCPSVSWAPAPHWAAVPPGPGSSHYTITTIDKCKLK